MMAELMDAISLFNLQDVLNELKIAKENGVLDKKENIQSQETKFRNVIEYEVLEDCVKNSDEKIRMGILNIMVESRKSTLGFTQQELKIILCFLRCNISEKLEFIPLIKKIFKRIKADLFTLENRLLYKENAREYRESNNIRLDEREEKLDNDLILELHNKILLYKSFFTNIREMCISGLSEESVYCHRKHSLQILSLMNDILKDEFKNMEWNFSEASTLLNCITTDSYESNKEMALEILVSICHNIPEMNHESFIFDCLKRAIRLANQSRPLSTIGAAYLMKFCSTEFFTPLVQSVLSVYFYMDNLSTNITSASVQQLIMLCVKKLRRDLAEEDIVKVVGNYSIYGYLVCIRELLSQCNLSDIGSEKIWQETIAEIIDIYFEHSYAVACVVNNSSPEGHLPIDIVSPNSVTFIKDVYGNVITPQMVLLCSWHTIKEVSLLFGLLVGKAQIQSRVGLLTEDQVIKIGEHLVTLLCETKHRGAFEQTYVGFKEVCNRLWQLENKRLNCLPEMWLHQILLAITGLADNNSKLCVTRRSAGVPFMIQAIVSTEPNLKNDTKISALNSVMKILIGLSGLEDTMDLQKEARELIYKESIFEIYESENIAKCDSKDKMPVVEAKTHALNILTALFKRSELGKFIKNHIASGLIVAFKNYDGKTWAEKNAATLLFGALIVRIFGVQRTKDHVNLTVDNKMTGRLFFAHYPDLLRFLINELNMFVLNDTKSMKPNIHSVLLLLSRLYPSENTDEMDSLWRIDEFTTLITDCAKSCVYKTRELAARALVPLLSKDKTNMYVTKHLQIIASGLDKKLCYNLIHGYMLQVLEILRESPFIDLDKLEFNANEFISRSFWILNPKNGYAKPNSYLLAALYLDITHELFKKNDELDIQTVIDTVKSHLQNPLELDRQEVGTDMYKISIFEFLITVEKNISQKDSSKQLRYKRNKTVHEMILSEHVDQFLWMNQVVAWNAATRSISVWRCIDEKSIVTRTTSVFRFLSRFVPCIQKFNPRFLDSIFNFIYTCIQIINATSEDSAYNLCINILKNITMNRSYDYYITRDSYRRLVAIALVTRYSGCELIPNSTHEKDVYAGVYDAFCDYSWISSLELEDFRKSVFDIFYKLFDCAGRESDKLQWWTTLMRLLVNDNPEIRFAASEIVHLLEFRSIRKTVYLKCTTETIDVLFNLLAIVYPQVALIVMSVWGLKLFNDADEETDETDIFDKSKTYEFFEPRRISELCIKYMNIIDKSHYDETELPSDVFSWIEKQLELETYTTITTNTITSIFFTVFKICSAPT